jgi:hypothetical protein
MQFVIFRKADRQTEAGRPPGPVLRAALGPHATALQPMAMEAADP